MKSPAIDTATEVFSMEDLNFCSTFLDLGETFSSRIYPSPLKEAYLVHGNTPVAELLGIDPEDFQHDSFVECFNGGHLHPGFKPLAMVYAGHQFGSYVPQLGDGRALLLGEIRNEQGHWDLVLKGGGRTPYSRHGDGRAVLRSTIREYLCGQAMAGLGIPTSLALCIFGSKEDVYRESIEPGASLVRVAQSHIRFGTFEYFFYTRRHDALKTLLDYTIERSFPEIRKGPDAYLEFYRQVVLRTAALMAQWQCVGFTHGVMNTDNMSIIGDTIDYGPYGFMDAYQSHYIPNHSDHTGRYAFDQQPSIALWNCGALGQALSPLIPETEIQNILGEYGTTLTDTYVRLMGRKFGFSKPPKGFSALMGKILKLMEEDSVDYTIFFRHLCDGAVENQNLKGLFSNKSAIDSWSSEYHDLLDKDGSEPEARRKSMFRCNPKYILRNYLAENAIRKAQDESDMSMIHQLMKVLASPFDEHENLSDFADHPPEWSRHLELSCSS